MPIVNISKTNPATQLIALFLAWKTLIILLVTFCPGPGYDTSGLILADPSSLRHANFQSSSPIDRLSLNFLRWDALYFIRAARDNYVNEQDWAFSWFYSLILQTASQYLPIGAYDSFSCYIWTGVVLSSASHLLSVLALFRLLNVVLGPQQNGRTPFIASVLHIVSPAGIFLTAPYTEAMFSMLNFGGMLHYALAKTGANTANAWSVSQDAYILSSGIQFAAATLLRSNGLLSGSIFLYDVASSLPRIFTMQLNVHEVRRIGVTCVAGILLALSFTWPQYLAYKDFCAGNNSGQATRPWCDKTLPSIYSWVQSHYWNVGLFRYWTLPNLPLFLIAAPMLWLLIQSSVTHLRNASVQPVTKPYVPQTKDAKGPRTVALPVYGFPEIALPQLVLAVLATTSFHVQIINRLSSGYPIWYLTIANAVVDQVATSEVPRSGRTTQYIVRGMIMYALVQGMLFANFLPPA